MLPSGRRLAYPQARLEPGRYTTQIVFNDNARGGWSDCRGWHGTFTENAVQAISRDLLAAAIMRLEAANHPVVLHVHDEVVCEVPHSGNADEFLQLMTALPDWAVGLPLAAKVWTRERYAKSTASGADVGYSDNRTGIGDTAGTGCVGANSADANSARGANRPAAG